MAKFFLTAGNLKSVVSELLAGLSNLRLTENVQGFEWKGRLSIDETLIENRMGPRIPKGFIVTDINEDAVIYRGETPWGERFLSLKAGNPTLVADVTVFFLG